MHERMYERICLEWIGSNEPNRYLGNRVACRYCGAKGAANFGNRNNAHTFPEALGNKGLFSLDECIACNAKFSRYDDALSKAVGPFLTLGGVKGKKGVRQTGRSDAPTRIRHSIVDGRRQISVVTRGAPDELVSDDPTTGILKVRLPIHGDNFVPLHAYKALMKMAVALLPKDELAHFGTALGCLSSVNANPRQASLNVGFSYAYVGNAPPTLAGVLLRRRDPAMALPYMLFLFQAGSVCFQIWLRSDDRDEHVPDWATSEFDLTSQLRKPDGTLFSIHYSKPFQLDWSDLSLSMPAFEAFDLTYNRRTEEGHFTPISRQSDG